MKILVMLLASLDNFDVCITNVHAMLPFLNIDDSDFFKTIIMIVLIESDTIPFIVYDSIISI
jgi:hypothetical protein